MPPQRGALMENGAASPKNSVFVRIISHERLPKPARGANGRNMRGVAFQVFPSFYRVLASTIHA